jgi:hypothetical protein
MKNPLSKDGGFFVAQTNMRTDQRIGDEVSAAPKRPKEKAHEGAFVLSAKAFTRAQHANA